MHLARHPIVHAVPPVLFLLLLFGFRDLQREPYLTWLLPAALVAAALALLLYVDAKKRLRYSHLHHDFGEDTERIYFSPHLSPYQKMMVMEQRTGCGTVLVAVGYFCISLLLIGLWVLGKYFPSKTL